MALFLLQLAPMRTSSTALMVVILATACGTSGGADPARPDGGVSSATVAPDGKGVCCPPSPAPACCMDFGGWAPRAEECGRATCDGMPLPSDPRWKLAKDEHGCDHWAAPIGGGCGSAVPPKDAGADGANSESCPSTRSEALALCASQSSCFREGIKCTYAADLDAGMDAGADAGTLLVECATKWMCSGN